MSKRLQYKRLVCLTLLLYGAYAGLAYRLVDLQVLDHQALSVEAQKNTQREFLREPRRGDILDARGNLLATSVFVKTVCADPVLLGNRRTDIARVLAPYLQVSQAELLQRLQIRVHQNEKGETVTNRYVVLKRKVPVETWEKIQAALSKLTFGVDEKKLPNPQQAFFRDLRNSAVFVDPVDDQQRVYPNQDLAAHVLGYVGMNESEVNGTPIQQTAGKDGIELAMNSKLSGARGWRVTETDRRRREMVAMREQDVEPRDGLNVVLTIDSVIQHTLEAAMVDAVKKHSPVSISGLVMRPRTGEILAMATLPDFDPNNPGAASPDARRNRVISDVVEPGSTFKIVVVSGALNERVVTLKDAFDCEHGRFAFAGRVLHDHESYGVLSVENIITKSSNIGAAKIGIKLGDDRLYDYIDAYGFGERTGITLPGEVAGIVHPVKDWSKVSIAQIPMGHGIATTRLQMMMAMCAIANDGWLMRPKIVDRLEDRDGNTVVRYASQPVRQVINEAAARQMVQALKTVVTADGTAPKAAMEHYTVAGKTGTAQKAGVGGYVPGKFVSSFIGFFPADNPEIAISIVMDEPRDGYYGGQVAAPVFKEIAARAASYLNIRPDVDEGKVAVAAAKEKRRVETLVARSANNNP